MSLVIEAEVLILVNPDRWDRPKFGDIAERRDGGEGERLRKNEAPSMARLPAMLYESVASPNRTGDFILRSVTLGRDRVITFVSKVRHHYLCLTTYA